MSILHEQYDANGDPVFFSCTECDYRTQSIGGLHANIEAKHWSVWKWLRWHLVGWYLEETSEQMASTEIVRVQELEEIPIEEVDGL